MLKTIELSIDLVFYSKRFQKSKVEQEYHIC